MFYYLNTSILTLSKKIFLCYKLKCFFIKINFIYIKDFDLFNLKILKIRKNLIKKFLNNYYKNFNL